jgi:hypothetical protein
MSPGDEMELKDVASVKEDMASVRQVETTLMDATPSEDAIFLDGFSAKEQNYIFRKVDFHIVPMLMLLYLFANLDRSVTPFVPPWLFPFLLVRYASAQWKEKKVAPSQTRLPEVIKLILKYSIRANIGNAKIEGLETSLGMSGSDYNVASMIFFLSYIVCEVPSNLIMVKYFNARPSMWLAIIVTAWV